MKIFKTLQTPRLIIRPLVMKDAQVYYEAEMASKNELAPHWSWVSSDKSIKEITDFIEEAEAHHLNDNPEEMYFSILSKDEGRFLGCIWFYPINWLVPHFEIHYWLDSREARKGYMSEAVLALSKVCFSLYKAKRVQIKISTENKKSQALVDKLGYLREAVMQNYFYNFVSKENVNGLLYACCANDDLPELEVFFET